MRAPILFDKHRWITRRAGASLHQEVCSGGGQRLGGNSVGMDKRFLERYMPEVIAHLHYRVIDVSTDENWRWYPAARQRGEDR